MTETEHDAFALPTAYRLNGYEIMRVLGYGGFGITYLAQKLDTGDRVAIKEYFPGDLAVRLEDGSIAPRSGEERKVFDWGLERFVNEAKTLARFSHPNIVGVQKFLPENNTAYMVMDYQQGVPFGQILDEHGDLEETEILELLPPLLDGLQAVHEADVLHRDIKPDNIYIRNDGSPVLLDFGAARDEIGQRSRSLHQVFTPGYAAPEQYETGGHQGPWTDIYGLAAVLYSAISGRAPLEAPARTGAMVRTQEDALEPARQVGNGRFAPAFLAAIDWGLQIDPSRRPQSIAAWRDSLLSRSAQIDGDSLELGTPLATDASALDPGATPDTHTLLAGGATAARPDDHDDPALERPAAEPAGGADTIIPAEHADLRKPDDLQRQGPKGRKVGLIAAAVLLLLGAGTAVGWYLSNAEKKKTASSMATAEAAARAGRLAERDAARKRDAALKEAERPKSRMKEPAKPKARLRPADRDRWDVGPDPEHRTKSLALAIANAPDNTVIRIHYRNIIGNFTLGRGLTLVGTGKGRFRTRIQCARAVCVTIDGNATLRNMIVARGGQGGQGPAIRILRGRANIVATWVRSVNGVGIDLVGGRLRLWQSRVFRSGGHGIVIGRQVAAVMVDSSTIAGNQLSGVVVKSKSRSVIMNSKIRRNRHHGVMVMEGGNAILRLNRVVLNHGAGVHIRRGARLTSDDNFFEKNDQGPVRHD